MSRVKKYLAECIGTFVLVLIACGVAAATGCSGSTPDASDLMTALAFGGVIVAMAYSIGNISGCHINPAVSLAMLINRKMTVIDFIGYVIAQIVGAILGAAVLMALVGRESGLGSNGLYDGSIAKSLVVEVILTFIFVLAVLGVTAKAEHSKVAGLVIGASLTLVHLFGIHFTGTSVNPARSLGPALFAGGDALRVVWVFLLAPLVGGALAAIVYRLLDTER
ncbi:MAG: MIP family channel protein [Oscillospiraceae bacterium]|nr:MIP family channel protein [Oscillospiraceae bacterium]